MANIDVEQFACQDFEGNLIGLDLDSGGYPWVPGQLTGVTFWTRMEDARDYANRNQFKLVRVKITVEEVGDEIRGTKKTGV